MRIVIDGQVYEARTMDSLAIKHALAFDRECAEHGYPVRWVDVERIRSEIRALETDTERERHPEALLLTAVTVWASLLAAGQKVTFEDAISMPFERIAFIVDEPEPEPAQDVAGPAAPDPQPARPGSGRADDPGKGKGKPARSRKRT
ncbi:MAG TPA: hypothetical protein VGF17_01430 [Phytomonospora sp.]